MEVKFNLNLNEGAQVEAFVNFLQTVADTAKTAGESLQEKPKPSRRKAATKTTGPKSDDKPKEEAKQEAKQETKQETADKPTISATDIKAEAAAKIKAGHREAIKAKLTDLGVKNVSSLAEQEYAGFMDFLKGL